MLSFLESKIVLNNIFGGNFVSNFGNQYISVFWPVFWNGIFVCWFAVFMIVLNVYETTKVPMGKSLGGPSGKPYAQKSMETSFDTVLTLVRRVNINSVLMLKLSRYFRDLESDELVGEKIFENPY